jgi:hypothetical protein
MLAHAKVVIGAPHDDVAHLAIVIEMLCRREVASHPTDVGKDAISAFLLEGAYRFRKFFQILHGSLPSKIRTDFWIF